MINAFMFKAAALLSGLIACANGDDQVFQLTHLSGSNALINLNGAAVISFTTANKTSHNFLAVDGWSRGLFPNVLTSSVPFGMYSNNLASQMWSLESNTLSTSMDNPSVAKFVLDVTYVDSFSMSLRAISYPKLSLLMSVRLKPDSLSITYGMYNVGNLPISFTGMLQSTLSAGNVRTDVDVRGLSGKTYVDQDTHMSMTDNGQRVSFDERVNRMYPYATDTVLITVNETNCFRQFIMIQYAYQGNDTIQNSEADHAGSRIQSDLLLRGDAFRTPNYIIVGSGIIREMTTLQPGQYLSLDLIIDAVSFDPAQMGGLI